MVQGEGSRSLGALIAAKAYGFEGGNSLRENEEVRFQPGMKLVSSIPTPLGSASSSVAYKDLKLRTEAVLHLSQPEMLSGQHHSRYWQSSLETTKIVYLG